jgi:glycosyltransferase involved in cell wall biosynthesis
VTGAWVVAVRAALPSPRPQGWQAFQQAVGLAEAGALQVHLVGDAAIEDGVPSSLERWLGRPLPAALEVHRPARRRRPPLAGYLFRRSMARLRDRSRTLLCRDPRVAAREAGRWRRVLMEWHVEPRPGEAAHRGAIDGADLHVASAAGLLDDLLRAGVEPGRIVLAHNACGLDRGRAAARAAAEGEGAVVALGLHRRGGLDLALDAWRLAPSLPPLLVAGRDQGGVRVDDWRARVAADPALVGRVELVGPAWGASREELLDRADAWLALYPEDDATRTRLCPLQVADAAGSGLPLVATDLPSIRSLLDGAPARYAHPGDPASVAAAVRAALDDGRRPPPARPDWADRAALLIGAAA